LKSKTVNSAILSIQLILTVIITLHLLKAYYYPTIHRVTLTRNFQVECEKEILLIIQALSTILLIQSALSSKRKLILTSTLIVSLSIIYILLNLGSIIVVLSITSAIVSIKSKITPISKVILWSMITLSLLEVISLIYWAALPIVPINPLLGIAKLEEALYYTFTVTVPPLILLMLLAWIMKPILLEALKIVRRNLKIKVSKATRKTKALKLSSKIILLYAMLLSIIIAVYPYTPNINPQNKIVGVDVKHYEEYIRQTEEDIGQTLIVAGGSRPLLVLLLYTLEKIIQTSPLKTVEYSPILLNPLLILATYQMMNQATKNKRISALTALLTALGYKLTVNMYSYFLANILALILIYPAMGFLMAALRDKNKGKLMLSITFMSLTIFTHPWTFTQYYASIALLTLIKIIEEIKGKKEDKNQLKMLIIFLAVTGIINVLKGSLIGGTEGIKATKTVTNQSVLDNLLSFWHNNIFAFRLLYGGYLSNLPLTILALIGAYKLKPRKTTEKAMISLLIATSIIYLLSDGTLQSRLIFNLPLEALAAIGLTYMLNYMKNQETKKTTLILTLTTLHTYIFRSLANLI